MEREERHAGVTAFLQPRIKDFLMASDAPCRSFYGRLLRKLSVHGWGRRPLLLLRVSTVQAWRKKFGEKGVGVKDAAFQAVKSSWVTMQEFSY